MLEQVPPPPSCINPCTCNVYVHGRSRNRRRTTCVKYSILYPFYDRSLASLSPSICVFCMEFHPRDSSHLYVGTDTGRVHHVTRYGRRPIPRFHTTTTENEGTLCTCCDIVRLCIQWNSSIRDEDVPFNQDTMHLWSQLHKTVHKTNPEIHVRTPP